MKSLTTAAVLLLLLSACATAPRQKFDITVNDQCLITKVVNGTVEVEFSKACSEERLSSLKIETEAQKNIFLGKALLITMEHLNPAQKAIASAAIIKAIIEKETQMGIEFREQMKILGITEEILYKNIEDYKQLTCGK
jgi:hypothetical protein